MALNFQTAGRYITLAYSRPADINLTMMVWVYFTAVGGFNQGIFSLNSSDPNTSTGLDGTGSVVFASGDTIGNVVTTYVPTVKTWTHITITHQSNSASDHVMNGYINGKLWAIQTDTTTYSTFTGINLPNANRQTLGYERDFRAWSRALTSEEVALEYKSSFPIHKSGLIVWSPFDNTTFKNQANTNLKWTTVGGTAVLVGLGGSNQTKRNNKRFR